jgi:hypothetical protein
MFQRGMPMLNCVPSGSWPWLSIPAEGYKDNI